jgi:hypothetical protein
MRSFWLAVQKFGGWARFTEQPRAEGLPAARVEQTARGLFASSAAATTGTQGFLGAVEPHRGAEQWLATTSPTVHSFEATSSGDRVDWMRSSKLLTVQQLAIAWIALGVCFLALGVISLVTNERWIGAGYLLVGIV